MLSRVYAVKSYMVSISVPAVLYFFHYSNERYPIFAYAHISVSIIRIEFRIISVISTPVSASCKTHASCLMFEKYYSLMELT